MKLYSIVCEDYDVYCFNLRGLKNFLQQMRGEGFKLESYEDVPVASTEQILEEVKAGHTVRLYQERAKDWVYRVQQQKVEGGK